MTYQVERTNEQVLTVRHTITPDWTQRYLLISDVHYDSPLCDRRLLTKLLDQAKDTGAGILVIGDWFDAMGGKQDKRARKEGVRVEDQRDNYFDILIDNSTDYLTPYRANILLISNGNHETAILKHNETDLLHRLCRHLDTNHMGYTGFIRMMFTQGKGGRSSKRIYFHHGAGGGGPVTKGVPQAHRRAASVDADIFLSGHIHESWVLENMMIKMNDSGRIILTTQTHIQLPTFKQEYGSDGYHIEKGRPPKPLGGYWLTFRYDVDAPGQVGYTVDRAN
jgi:predicted phosphodiesterase